MTPFARAQKKKTVRRTPRRTPPARSSRTTSESFQRVPELRFQRGESFAVGFVSVALFVSGVPPDELQPRGRLLEPLPRLGRLGEIRRRRRRRFVRAAFDGSRSISGGVKTARHPPSRRASADASGSSHPSALTTFVTCRGSKSAALAATTRARSSHGFRFFRDAASSSPAPFRVGPVSSAVLASRSNSPRAAGASSARQRSWRRASRRRLRSRRAPRRVAPTRAARARRRRLGDERVSSLLRVPVQDARAVFGVKSRRREFRNRRANVSPRLLRDQRARQLGDAREHVEGRRGAAARARSCV